MIPYLLKSLNVIKGDSKEGCIHESDSAAKCFAMETV
jgi:hypothetical protein